MQVLENPGCEPGPYLDGWINTACYPDHLVWFFGGCFLWVIVYGILIYNGFRYRFIEMPAIALAGNFAWEFTWSFLNSTNMGLLATYTYRAWFFVDVGILLMLLRWGHKQGWSPFFFKYFKPTVFVAILMWGAMFYSYTLAGYTDHYIGAISAYLDNVAVSALYIFMLQRIRDVRAMSPWVAWLKMIGTGMNTVFMFLVFTQDHFLHTVAVVVFVLDCIYIVMLRQRRKAQAAGIEGVPLLGARGPVQVQSRFA
jgi:hypothetical protein